MNKSERTNIIEAAAILEGAQEQLNSTSLEFTRIEHNINELILNIQEAISKLMTGGVGE